ncbi:MAG: AMP-binding protein [Cyanobacteria bacterium J06607_13]
MLTPAEIWQRPSIQHLFAEQGQIAEGMLWTQYTEALAKELSVRAAVQASAQPLLLVCDRNPVLIAAAFWAALLAGWDVALANPRWGRAEWQSVSQQLQPSAWLLAPGSDLLNYWEGPTEPFGIADGLFGGRLCASRAKNPKDASEASFINAQKTQTPRILIPTGGSSGQVKFVCHCWASLTASVEGFCKFFQTSGELAEKSSPRPVKSYCVLPMYHVSGLMQMLRAAATDGTVLFSSFRQLETAPPLVTDPQDWFISLVPTQLTRLIRANKAGWLSGFQTVLLGGAPAWPTLLAQARSHRIPLCLSYGMTETAAMVTALSPQDFLQGCTSSGQPLPHADVRIEKAGRPVPTGQSGQVVVRSGAIAQGYYASSTSAFTQNTFYTDDMGYFSADGQLHLTGRLSQKIISGGENIFPAEVEAALRATGQVVDVCVLGLPHPDWGEAVAAAYVPAAADVSPASLKAALSQQASSQLPHAAPPLSHYKHPKQWFALAALPRNAQGKLNRAALLNVLEKSQHLEKTLPPSESAPLAGPDGVVSAG